MELNLLFSVVLISRFSLCWNKYFSSCLILIYPISRIDPQDQLMGWYPYILRDQPWENTFVSAASKGYLSFLLETTCSFEVLKLTVMCVARLWLTSWTNRSEGDTKCIYLISTFIIDNLWFNLKSLSMMNGLSN